MKELDKGGLEFIKLDAMKRMTKLEERAQREVQRNERKTKTNFPAIKPKSRGAQRDNDYDDETAIDYGDNNDGRYDANMNERSPDNSD